VPDAAAAPLQGGLGALDWAVVVALFALTHWIGQRSAGKPATIRDFFLGGRKLPWYAVSASIIATEISAVTLISLPATVFRAGGNICYLQLGLIGLFLARWIVALWLIPRYFEREIYSPYDFMGHALGARVKGVATILFSIGGVLGQAARVYLTGIVLELVLHQQFAAFEAATGIRGLWAAIAVIGIVAVAWTWMGGMTTVIWTDAVLFLVFLAAIALALITAVARVDGGVAEVVAVGREAGKFQFFDFEPTFGKANTFWAALVANTWVGVGAFGTDQLMAQRVFCCKNAREARKAMLASYLSMSVAVLVALVGVALYAYYQQHPLEGAALELYQQKNDRIFPIFILEALPSGVKGLIVAGAFAAAISSLDSILAALSQTVMSAFYLPQSGVPVAGGEARALRVSKLLVVVFGVLLCVIAAACELVQRDPRFSAVLDLALSMPGYTQGALLAAFALAFCFRGRVDGSGYLWSAPLSVIAVLALAWHEPWTAITVAAGGALLLGAWIRTRHFDLDGPRVAPGPTVMLALFLIGLVMLTRSEIVVAWPWFAPAGCTTAFAFGYLLRRTPTQEGTP
jgi:SSS family transporter